MSKPDAWMPFYVGDYLADTTRLTLEQHGAYLKLILDYWRNGPPPDDDVALALIVGVTVHQWKKIAQALRPKFMPDKGVLRHKRIDAELADATDNRNRAEEKAKKAAAARWGKENPSSPDPSSKARSNAPSIPQAMHVDCPSPSPLPEGQKLEGLRPLSDSAAPSSDVVPLPQTGKPPRLRSEAAELLAFLNAKTGRHFRPTDTTLKPLMARLKEGFSVSECRAVIARKVREWGPDDKMRTFLRPDTLFGATKFAQYIGEVPPEEAVS